MILAQVTEFCKIMILEARSRDAGKGALLDANVLDSVHQSKYAFQWRDFYYSRCRCGNSEKRIQELNL